MANAHQKTCFIIMPISTPEMYIDKYRDREDHFKHVLECLFIPSIKEAGYEPIPPVAKGSDLIHAEIIKNLEQADLVLCDMSCLNPNVFFEWGIRTALNKPVCILRDEIPIKVPFDTGILNFEQYKSTLEPWELPGEIKKVSEHAKTSLERSKGENTLWKYFGIKSEARPITGKTGSDDKIDMLMMQFEALQRQLKTQRRPISNMINQLGSRVINDVGAYENFLTTGEEDLKKTNRVIEILLMRALGGMGAGLGRLEIRPAERIAYAEIKGMLPPQNKLEEIKSDILARTGFTVKFINIPMPGHSNNS